MMLVLQNSYRNLFFLLLICAPWLAYSNHYPESFGFEKYIFENEAGHSNAIQDNDLICKSSCKKYQNLSYYIYIEDFIQSFIEIPTSNVFVDSSTISSKYLAGRAPVYNLDGKKVGVCSASFLCMQNADGIFTDISNYLSIGNGLIISWFTPTTLINLELDSIVHSMVTECLVLASTKVGFNPFYGKRFNMVVSSDNEKIYFNLTKL